MVSAPFIPVLSIGGVIMLRDHSCAFAGRHAVPLLDVVPNKLEHGSSHDALYSVRHCNCALPGW